ncbi:MAG: dihydropteroate synthase [SAR202 cluster bacterium]|nr:dihydropteroate synthase [SAR202 cluster bacterium]|tara:strand:- start:22990 stop:23829 length:840 start_codon:yes stop_codon:yes gene_type:complete
MINKMATNIGGKLFNWKSKTFVMGVINVTPDSFSGDGLDFNIDLAVQKAVEFERFGCHILDIGGESTRPSITYGNTSTTSAELEEQRVIPAIQAISKAVSIPISIDTYKASVAQKAIQSGASLVNDVWGFTKDPKMASIVSDLKVPVVLMHNQDHTVYGDMVNDIINRLEELKTNAMNSGVLEANIILDPGIGFGKNVVQNIELFRSLEMLQKLNSPILIGSSRKSTIGKVLDLPPDQRVEGTAATVVISIIKGADIVRVHDVKEMMRVVKMTDAIVRK